MAETLEQKKEKLEKLNAIEHKDLATVMAIHYLSEEIDKATKKNKYGNG